MIQVSLPIDVESLPDTQVCVDDSHEAEIVLVVMAKDKGYPALSSTVNVTIRIEVSKSITVSTRETHTCKAIIIF